MARRNSDDINWTGVVHFDLKIQCEGFFLTGMVLSQEMDIQSNLDVQINYS